MNNVTSSEISDFQKKMNGYLMLFNIRLGNFCVKADPTAMLPVTVTLGDSEYNFEDVASATKPDDYNFDVTPKNQNNLQTIIQGVAQVHPEFKFKVKVKETDSGNEERHIIYTMPDVDKDRRDLLNEVCKTFHTECKAKLDAAYAKRLADTAELFLQVSEDADEARKSFKSAYDEAKDNADKMLDAKLQEIEEGYQRYLSGSDNTWEDPYKDDTEGEFE